MRLSVNDITKSFGSVAALDGVSFTAESGSPFGLLGRNGAGKTTTMRIIMDVFRPDSGSVTLDGVPLEKSGARLGYLPEERGLYRKTRVGEQLEYFARLRGMSAPDAHSAVVRWLERLDMGDAYKKKVETLSKGNQQRIQLALALINDPDVIILDEPFSGLDPVNAKQLRDIVADEAKRGKLIIFSSHQMNAVEDFCDDIMILRHGRSVLSGRLAEIRSGFPRTLVRIAARDPEKAATAVERFGTVEPTGGGLLLHLTSSVADCEGIMRALLESGAGVITCETVEPSLEQIFVTYASDDDVSDEGMVQRDEK